MIEIELYRLRIGTFGSKILSSKCLAVKVSSHVSRQHRSFVKILVTVWIVGLCLGLLDCQQLKEREALGLPSSLATTCNKLLCFVRSVGELGGNIPDNARTRVDSWRQLQNWSYSYLLGNGGQHAYNGNPPKKSSTSPPDKAAKIKELHYNMVLQLNGELHPNTEREWEKVKGMLRIHLSPAEIGRACNMFEVCEELLTKGIIRYGQYENLKKLFPGHQICCGIVDSCSREIEELQHHQPQQENIRSEVQQVAAVTENIRSEVEQVREEMMTREETSRKNPTDAMALYVESWKEQDKLCYETKGVQAVKEKICNQSYVCVIGVPGSGKSTAIRHAALHLQETSKYSIYPLPTLKEFDKYLDKDRKQVFVMDDVVGEYSVDKEMLGSWDKLNDRVKSCLEVSKNTKFLTSLRRQLYLDETLKGKIYIFNDTNKKVDFTDEDYKLSTDDMINMLRHYLEVRNVADIEALIRRIWWRGDEVAKSADCFPLLCKVFSDNESVRKDPGKFFRDPFPALTDIFRQIKTKNKHQFCGLLLCAFTELKPGYFSPHYPHDKPKIVSSLIKSQNLDPKKDLDDIKKALQTLDGVYISQVANKYDFLHSTFRDITTFLYEDQYVIFQHATRGFINSRVRLFSKLSEDDDYVLVFGEDCVELLTNRMIHELKCQTWQGARFIVDNRYIDDERVVNGLCTKLFDSQDTEITQDMVGGLFGKCTETVERYCHNHRDNRDEMSWQCHKLLMNMFSSFDCTRQKYVIFQHATRGFINSRVRLFSKLSEDDDNVLVFGEDCVELLANRMIHELKCQTEWGEGAGFIVGNPYIDDDRVVNGLCTKLFDSQDTDITQDMVDGLFGECTEVVGMYSVLHRDNRDEMSWRCHKLLMKMFSSFDCTRQKYVIFQHATCNFIKSRVRLFSKLSEDDDYVLVFGEDCVELLANRMIHELKCQTEWGEGAGFIVDNRYIDDERGVRFIVGNRYIDDERVVNGLCTKLFDSQDTDITQDMVDELFERCTGAVWGYSDDSRDEMSWRCHKLLMKMFSSFDCTRQKYVIFQHATCNFIKSRVRLFSKLSEDDDYVLVFGEDCVELLANRMIHELKCQPGQGAAFIVGNRYIDDERVVNGLCTKLFDSQDTDITQDMVGELFEECMFAVWRYCRDHRDNRDEMSWPCYKLLVRLIPRVDCARRVVGRTYPVLWCVATGSVSLTKLVVQQNNVDINAVDGLDHSVLHWALRCGNSVEMTRYLLGLPNLTRLDHGDIIHRTPHWYVVRGRDWRGGEIPNRQDMVDMYKQAGAIALGDSSDDDGDSSVDDGDSSVDDIDDNIHVDNDDDVDDVDSNDHF